MNYFRCGGGRSTHTASQLTVAKTPLASFESNVSGLYIPEILAYIQATQAGTGDPSPSNPRAISGVSEVNVANMDDSDNVSFFQGLLNGTYGFVDLGSLTYNKDTSTLSGVTIFTAQVSDRDTSALDGICSIYEVSTSTRDYLLTHDKAITKLYATDTAIAIRDSQYDSRTAAQFKTAMSGAYLIYKLATPTTPIITPIELNMLLSAFGTEKAFINLGGTYYGGYLNVTTGLLTITRAYYKTTGNENFKSYTYGSKNGVWVENVLPYVGNRPPYVSNMSKYSISTLYQSGSLWCGANSKNLYWIGILDILEMTLDEFKVWIVNNPLEVAYELATPITVQLTPAQLEQLLGQNNVFCSSGDVAVKYWKID